MQSRPISRIGAVTFALFIAVAGCGGDGGGSAPTAPATPPPPALTPLSFLDIPTETVTVEAGETREVTVRLSAAIDANVEFVYDPEQVAVEGVILQPGVVQLSITGVGVGQGTIGLVAEAAGYQRAEASFAVHVEEVELTLSEFYVLVKLAVEEYWNLVFADDGLVYSYISVFEGYGLSGISTPCGEVEPWNAVYCPANAGVYYHTAFLDSYSEEIGPMASAFIISHEIGHHVSWQLGFIPGENMSLKQNELQADCFGGAWAAEADREFGLTSEDLHAAAQALIEVGNPEYSWFDPDIHGTGAQRLLAFFSGFSDGPAICADPDWLEQFPLAATETLARPLGDGARELDPASGTPHSHDDE